MRRRLRRGAALVAAVVFLPSPARAILPAAPSGTDETAALAVEAYAYAYPLVLTELARRTALASGAVANRFTHQRTLADAATVDPLRPNPDVLQSTLWFDVAAEPLVVAIPDAGDHWWDLPMFDAWMEVFATPGPRTSGGGAQTWAIVAPGWSGTLPPGVGRIEAPTPTGWIAARIATHDASEYDAVHRFQDGLVATPLGSYGKPAAATTAASPTAVASAPPSAAAQILRLSTNEFFAIFTALTKTNRPHAQDWSILQRMARIGIAPGAPFAPDRLPADAAAVVQQTPRTAGQVLFDAWKRSGTRLNGWRSLLTPMGAYGTDYRRRQVVAYSAFGAETSDDVYFLTTIAGADGQPLESSERYVLHFEPDMLPPVQSFWSLAMYDDQNHLPGGTRPRLAIGSRDPLVKNPDGSLDVLVQAKPPAADRLANWLPPPAEGRFSMTLRLYRAGTSALDGFWMPPAVTRVGESQRGTH